MYRELIKYPCRCSGTSTSICGSSRVEESLRCRSLRRRGPTGDVESDGTLPSTGKVGKYQISMTLITVLAIYFGKSTDGQKWKG